MLHLWKRPLPTVLAESILAPRHCSDPFQWPRYEQGWTDVDGQRLMAVPGGSDWRGGVCISAVDKAHICLMPMAGGKVGGLQMVSANRLRRMHQPCEVAPYDGSLVWLNLGSHLPAAAPRSAWFAIGKGSSLTCIDAQTEQACV